MDIFTFLKKHVCSLLCTESVHRIIMAGGKDEGAADLKSDKTCELLAMNRVPSKKRSLAAACSPVSSFRPVNESYKKCVHSDCVHNVQQPRSDAPTYLRRQLPPTTHLPTYLRRAEHVARDLRVMVGGWVFLTHRLQKRGSPEVLLGAILAWGLATSPVLFPWYALSVLPLLAVAPSGILVGWTSALPFSYEVIDAFDLSGVWAPSEWPQILLALCVGLGMAIDRRNERQAVLGGHEQSQNSTNTE